MSALPPVPPPPRSPWQLLYGVVLARRARRLAAGAASLPRPVVSVGNLAWGGGGKTPFTIALAARLRDGGRRVAVLSRGYGRVSRGVRLVSRGDGPQLPVAQAGDEPYEMAVALPGVAVVVGERRVEAGRHALAELAPPPDLFVLDDGFSHCALARDVDLLLFPAADPWAKGRLLPSGRLREPLAAARRADAVLLTGGGDGEALARSLAVHGYAGPGFAAPTEVAAPRGADGAALAPGTKAFAVAGIAAPGRFFAAARAAGVDVVGERAEADHAAYGDDEIRALDRDARRCGAEVVLTTAKDAAKLTGRVALPLAVLPIAARPEPAFWRWLEARLAEVRR
ncbi:MAG: tetraacyldisaccharide 4'-kinase [Thermoanaerobaculia bacterium]|nr:tetraacyldisaccharide 4'-kinase [Thermoanaerobaculia bacterium]